MMIKKRCEELAKLVSESRSFRKEEGINILSRRAAFAHVVEVIGDATDSHGELNQLFSVELNPAGTQECFGFVQAEWLNCQGLCHPIVQSSFLV